MVWRRAAVIVVVVLLLGIIGYLVAGFAYSGARIAEAEGTLDSVVSHQNSLNLTFGDINTQLSVLNTSQKFDSEQALTLVERSIANSELAMMTINQDDQSLQTAAGNLRSLPWLMMPRRDSVDRDAARIVHARSALAAARAVAIDEARDGRFWHALYVGLADFTALNSQSAAGDLVAARTSLGRMKTDIDLAVQLATAPALPTDLRSLMSDLQSFMADYSKKLDAQAASDDTALLAAESAVDTDTMKIATYNIDKIGQEIETFYKPLIDRYNAEITAATT